MGSAACPAHRPAPEHWLPSSQRQTQEPGGDLGIHRQTLREILLAGLQERVRFGYTLCEFAQTPQGVELQFANGEHVRVDVLIAADGVNSLVRRARPRRAPKTAGAVTPYGKTPLDAATRAHWPLNCCVRRVGRSPTACLW